MLARPEVEVTHGTTSRKLRCHSAKRAHRRTGVMTLAAFGAAALAAGCDVSTARSDFRGAAANGLETGVRAILGGVIDGAFAVFSAGANTNAGSGPSGALTDSGSGSSTNTSGGTSSSSTTP